MNKLSLKKWDSAAHLQSNADITAYLNACLQENDAELISHALQVISKAKGIMQTNDTLINENNLALSTFFTLINALNIHLCVDEQHI